VGDAHFSARLNVRQTVDMVRRGVLVEREGRGEGVRARERPEHRVYRPGRDLAVEGLVDLQLGGEGLGFRTTTSQKCEAVPRRARI